eukprot:sb/3477133/
MFHNHTITVRIAEHNVLVHNMIITLLSLSRTGGRLAYWLPIIRDLYQGDVSLPQHPAFRLIYNCEQIFSRKSSRRLVVMLKTRERSEGETSFVVGDSAHGQYRDLYFAKN